MLSTSLIKKDFVNKIMPLARLSMILCLFLFCCGAAAADERSALEDEFYKANSYYEAGNYKDAIGLYETILASGISSPNLHYNLGNSYLESGQIGSAILHYRKAIFYMPRDSGLRTNYKYALSMMKQRDPNISMHSLLRIVNGLFDMMTIGESYLLFGLLYLAFALLFAASRFVPRYRLAVDILAVFFFVILVLTILPLSNKINDLDREGVIISQIADAKIAPLDDAASGFPMYEGMRAYILKKMEFGWVKIKRPDGKIGWIKDKDIKAVCE